MKDTNTRKDGIELAEKYDFDILSILDVAKCALEQANAHTESRVVSELQSDLVPF